MVFSKMRRPFRVAPSPSQSPNASFNQNDPELLGMRLGFDQLTQQVDAIHFSCEKTEAFNQTMDTRMAGLETMLAKLTLKLDDAAGADSFKSKSELHQLHESIESFEDMGQMLEENQNLDHIVERVRREQLVQHHATFKNLMGGDKKRHPALACLTGELTFDPHDHRRQMWDLAMTALLLYSMAEVPLQVAFGDELAIGWRYFDVLVDLLFIIDIGVNFRTAFYVEGKLITGGRKIATHYAVAHSSDGDAHTPRPQARACGPHAGPPPPFTLTLTQRVRCIAQATATRWWEAC